MIKILKNSLTTKYFQFAGRSSRKEYWIIYLLELIAGNTVFFIIKINDILGLKIVCLSILILFFIFIPSISVSVRRLHDCNISGWWFLCFSLFIVFLTLQEYYNNIIFNVFVWVSPIISGFIPGTPTTNKYGEPPTY